MPFLPMSILNFSNGYQHPTNTCSRSSKQGLNRKPLIFISIFHLDIELKAPLANKLPFSFLFFHATSYFVTQHSHLTFIGQETRSFLMRRKRKSESISTSNKSFETLSWHYHKARNEQVTMTHRERLFVSCDSLITWWIHKKRKK